jgi:hypothetical protein
MSVREFSNDENENQIIATEKAYIVISELTKIRMMKTILRSITPENVPEMMGMEEFRVVSKWLSRWERRGANLLADEDGKETIYEDE